MSTGVSIMLVIPTETADLTYLELTDSGMSAETLAED